MRTTVTLDRDTAEIVLRIRHDHRMTMSQAVIAAIRAGDAALRGDRLQYTFPKDMGTAHIDIDEASHVALASHVAAVLEDDEILARTERTRTDRPA